MSDGADAYQAHGDMGYDQNPYIVGQGREEQARDWWREFDDERRRCRKVAADAAMVTKQKRVEEFHHARLETDARARALRRLRNA